MRQASTLRTINTFRTDDPDELDRQLGQFEQNVDDAIRGVANVSPSLLRPTNLKRAAYTAAVDELVLCSGTFAVKLPVGSVQNIGRQVGVLVTTAGTITVSSAKGNVQNGASDALATVGLRVYVSDGTNWWRAP